MPHFRIMICVDTFINVIFSLKIRVWVAKKTGTMSRNFININYKASKMIHRVFCILLARSRGSTVSRHNAIDMILSHGLGPSPLPHLDIFRGVISLCRHSCLALLGHQCQHRTPTNCLITNLRQIGHPLRRHLEKWHFMTFSNIFC